MYKVYMVNPLDPEDEYFVEVEDDEIINDVDANTPHPVRVPPTYSSDNSVVIRTYLAKNNLLEEYFGKPIDPVEFYLDVFPLELMEHQGEYSEEGKWKSNPIFATTYHTGKLRKKGRHKGEEIITHRNEIVFQESIEDAVKRACEYSLANNEVALCSCCTFLGRSKSAKNAYLCMGFIVDVDGVGVDQIDAMVGMMDEDIIPRPTYIANSGYGAHLYFLFERPVELTPLNKIALKKLKEGVTTEVWNMHTSRIDITDRQYQGIYQNFRMIGSNSKLGCLYKCQCPVTAYQMGERVSLWYLDRYVLDEFKINVAEDASCCIYEPDNHINLVEAKEKYPEWYQRRIVEKKPRNEWDINPALYEWWKREIIDGVAFAPGLANGAREGHRYHCICMLFTYARKCHIPKDKVYDDALDLLPLLQSRSKNPGNFFTAEDIKAASSFYDKDYAPMITRVEIMRRTGLLILANKRNRRPQKVHMQIMRATEDIIYPDKEWRNKEGAPKKDVIVRTWRETHPDGKKAECIRETGLSKMTVYKWWDSISAE